MGCIVQYVWLNLDRSEGIGALQDTQGTTDKMEAARYECLNSTLFVVQALCELPYVVDSALDARQNGDLGSWI